MTSRQISCWVCQFLTPSSEQRLVAGLCSSTMAPSHHLQSAPGALFHITSGSSGALLAPPLTLLPAFISHHHTIITISGDKQQSTMPRLNTNNFFSLKSPCQSIAFVRRSKNTKKPINRPKSNPHIPVRMGSFKSLDIFVT